MNDLINSITAAFPAGLPAPRRIVVHECPECARVTKDFAGKCWTALAADVIRHHADSLPLLSPEAFAYYLPAYLRVAAAEPASTVGELLVYGVAPDSLERRAPHFNLAQRRLLLEVVELVAGAEEHFQPFLQQARAIWLGG